MLHSREIRRKEKTTDPSFLTSSDGARFCQTTHPQGLLWSLNSAAECGLYIIVTVCSLYLSLNVLFQLSKIVLLRVTLFFHTEPFHSYIGMYRNIF